MVPSNNRSIGKYQDQTFSLSAFEHFCNGLFCLVEWLIILFPLYATSWPALFIAQMHWIYIKIDFQMGLHVAST